MSLFAGLGEAVNTTEEIGGGGDITSGRFLYESGLYPMTVKVAYGEVTEAGSMALVLHLEDEERRIYQEKLWIQSSTAKGGKAYYERNGKKTYLPGFVAANDLVQLTLDTTVDKLATEEKIISLYDFQERKEVPTKVRMAVDLIGKEIIVGMIKSKRNRNVKIGNDYKPSTREEEENSIDKFFRASDSKTVTETKDPSMEKGAWIDRWDAQNTGKTKDRTVRDKSTLIDFDEYENQTKQSNPSAGGGKAPGAAVPSLFGD